MTEADSPINIIVHPASGECECGGLTKREHLAAMAMQGILANSGIMESVSESIEKGEYVFDKGKDLVAVIAIQMADSLIEALNKQP